MSFLQKMETFWQYVVMLNYCEVIGLLLIYR